MRGRRQGIVGSALTLLIGLAACATAGTAQAPDPKGLQTLAAQRGLSWGSAIGSLGLDDPALKALAASLGRALPKQPIVSIVDASADEQKLVLFAGSDFCRVRDWWIGCGHPW